MKETDSYLDRPLFNAADLLAHRRRQARFPRFPPPPSVIFCYQRSLVRARGRRLRRVGGFFGDFYLVKEAHGAVGVAANFGLGAPAAVALMEELAAFGVQRFMSIGLAGGLQNDLRPGNMLVCQRALRGEGVSRHYLPPAPDALAAPDLLRRLEDALQAAGQPYILGTSWTTDAPYRETPREIEQYRQAGAQVVEMEAAALFAAGQALGVQVGAALVVGDLLSPSGWQPDLDPPRTQRSLEALFDAAVRAML